MAARDARCDGTGEPAEYVTAIAGNLIGVCPRCRHAVACDADGLAASHDRDDVMRLF